MAKDITETSPSGTSGLKRAIGTPLLFAFIVLQRGLSAASLRTR